MKSTTIATKLVTPLKVCLFIGLALVAFNATAGCCYVGNPVRPYVTWFPGHYHDGCWVQGYYIEVMNSTVCCRNIVWVCGRCDRHGGYIDGHYRYRHYVVVHNTLMRDKNDIQDID